MAKKYKKMTKKEFTEVLESSGMYFENWGYEGILIIMCIAYKHLAEESERIGCYNCAEHERKRKEQVYEYLRERGYFEQTII